ncbi:MAG: ABC transporter ATP-binding protein [Bacteroidales bacterium]|nr:ABC transporter ATP-binding protein [Bacteroidales bacterium]MCF8344827.1 ABC transporter ATP-binding protein [Bacteroidales bacterium]MCF8351722.1 ABC transporter ATP-binding protein [Bacteroidales bacterium]MCF8377048.1 ABC transporter ATP-binding protein [Bacteroidales bacterium]MCF8400922.1 ABC transporter ATP-binding protein [Bacteroidales bacterium]
MAVIDINKLHFAYNGDFVLEDINETIEAGKFVGILGPNGSGKTTLLKCINGLLNPQKGQVQIDKEKVESMDQKEIARKVAYVPQIFSNVFPATVFDTILMGRKPHLGWRPSDRDLNISSDIILKLDLANIALKDINKLSGGQRQRVFIGRALAQEPQIILLDEPTANLDLHHQHEVMGLLKSLSNQNITVIVAIHDLNLAMQYCSDFLLLNNKKIAARGGHDIFRESLIEETYQVKVKIIKDKNIPFIIPLKNH